MSPAAHTKRSATPMSVKVATPKPAKTSQRLPHIGVIDQYEQLLTRHSGACDCFLALAHDHQAAMEAHLKDLKEYHREYEPIGKDAAGRALRCILDKPRAPRCPIEPRMPALLRAHGQEATKKTPTFKLKAGALKSKYIAGARERACRPRYCELQQVRREGEGSYCLGQQGSREGELSRRCRGPG